MSAPKTFLIVFLCLIGLMMSGCGSAENGQQAHIKSLIKQLGDGDAFVRLKAAYALGQIGPAAKEAVPALIMALGDESTDIRAKAAWALGQILILS